MSAAAFVLGVGLGGAAWALFTAQRTLKSNSSATAASSNTDGAAPTESRAPIREAIWTPQTPQDVQDLLRTACGCVDAGPLLDDDSLALCIWRAHWPAVAQPREVIEGDHPSVREALDAVRLAIQAAHAGECQKLPDVEADEAPSLPPPPIVGVGATQPVWAQPVATEPAPTLPKFGRVAAEPASPITPAVKQAVPAFEFVATAEPVDMVALTRSVPTPGYFYQVHAGDRLLGDQGILARALIHAVLEAAEAKGWSAAKAKAHAAALGADVKARASYSSIVQCSPWNDAMYGTWGYSTHDVPAAHGRAIRMIARHDRVYDRLADGQAPIRTLDRGVPMDKGTGSATGAGQMPELLWLPPLRVDALLDPNRSQQIVTEGLVWSDGSSKYNPPPAVQQLGIENAPAGPWGCKGIAA